MPIIPLLDLAFPTRAPLADCRSDTARRTARVDASEFDSFIPFLVSLIASFLRISVGYRFGARPR